MDISQTRAFYGLRSVATPTSAYITNDVNIGIANTTSTIPDADTIFAVQGLIVGTATLAITSDDNDSTGSTAWTPGAAQVETATAAGTVTSSGNATVTVTAAGMTGSPKAISVAVLDTDTASAWAAKVRTALAADTAVSALFAVSGTTTSIVLTRNPLNTYAVGSIATPTYPADDATLNIAIANGTSAGITAAPTSADTTAGAATAGVFLVDADGKDFEGNTLSTIAASRQGAYIIRNDSASLDDIVVTSAGFALTIPPNGGFQFWALNCDGEADGFSIAVTSGEALVSFVSCGSTT
jgi:hypothetical protein